MKYTNILIAVALLFFASCHKNSFTIDGTISGGAGKTIYIEELTPTEPLFLDSISLDADGHFSYTAEIPYARTIRATATAPQNPTEISSSAAWAKASHSTSAERRTPT